MPGFGIYLLSAQVSLLYATKKTNPKTPRYAQKYPPRTLPRLPSEHPRRHPPPCHHRPHLRHHARVLALAPLPDRQKLVQPPLLVARQRRADQLLAAAPDAPLGRVQHGRHEPLKQLLARRRGVRAREVERLDDGGARQCAKEQVEGFGGLEDGLCGVVVGEQEGEVGAVGGVADEGRGDFVGEFGGEGGVGEVFEGELGGLARGIW